MVRDKDSSRKEELIAEREWRRASSLAWPGLAVGNLIQGYLAEDSFKPWLVKFAIALVVAGIVSWILNALKFRLNFIPVIFTLCAAPIFIGDSPSTSWTSIGLTIFAATIYFASIQKVWLAIVVNVGLVGIQTWIASLHLKSVSDSEDMLYGFGYFSIIWTLSIGLASIWISRQYFKTSEEISSLITNKLNEQAEFFKSIKQINERDSKNQRLHGTILNSLIAAQKSWTSFEDAKIEYQKLQESLKEIDSSAQRLSSGSIRDSLNETLENRPLKRIEILNLEIADEIENPQIKEAVLEIFREFLLNLEKHTNATQIHFSLKVSRKNIVTIQISDNALAELNESEKNLYLNKILESRTLSNLIASYKGKISLSQGPAMGERISIIEIPTIDLDKEFKVTLSKIRFTGVFEVVNGYGRAVLISAILSFFGYLVESNNNKALALIAISVIFFSLAMRKVIQYLWLTIATFSSLLIMPAIAFPFSSCQNITLLPWVFNMVLGLSFLFTLHTKKNSIRWIPVLLLLVESLAISKLLDSSCQNILLGSIPAIPLLIAISIVIIRIREREFSFDERYAREVKEAATRITEVDTFKNKEFSELLDDVSKDLDRLVLLRSEEEFRRGSSFLIQKIRTFLNFDEYFESKMMRDLYTAIKSTSTQKQTLRISIFGEGFQFFDEYLEGSYLSEKIKQASAGNNCHVTLVKTEKLEITIAGPQIEPKRPIENVNPYLVIMTENSNLEAIADSLPNL